MPKKLGFWNVFFALSCLYVSWPEVELVPARLRPPLRQVPPHYQVIIIIIIIITITTYHVRVGVPLLHPAPGAVCCNERIEEKNSKIQK